MSKTSTKAPRPAVAAKHTTETTVDRNERVSNADHTQFAMFLHAARLLWRAHPELVEASKMPEPYASAFRQECGDPEAGSCGQYGCRCPNSSIWKTSPRI